ncbi:4Fe-4S ferredoxin, nitrogenase-associated [Rhodovulum sp. P5]|uniref:4Fe-4S binding protein n=1 Tax=Rhodovulum sp. P5 TaxID=1564506 RepID=UPI0009C328A1|nr:4Fe-4S binding protein [Rhodovulum sp. P5]ARE40495.1 4Fe-4S ferredoxin, nitrogenase-associated [Rhodovulum sp. P5]
MAYKIVTETCTACGACEFECPNAAIRMVKDTFVVDPNLCSECEGHFENPQCAEVCPVPNTCIPA